MHVSRVTIRVELDNGDVIEMHEDLPGPHGDNPRYLVQQAVNGTLNVQDRVYMALTGAYGRQILPNKDG